jgi:hypothetical protein
MRLFSSATRNHWEPDMAPPISAYKLV